MSMCRTDTFILFKVKEESMRLKQGNINEKPVIFLGFISVFAAWLALSASPVSAASFDCAKAKTQVENIICANSTLSGLDDAVNAAYKAAIAADDRESAIREQRAWLKERNGCTSAECIQRLYTGRLKELKGKREQSPVLRQIVRPQNKTMMQKIVSAKEFLQGGPKKFPPYPDVWGVELPRNGSGNTTIWGMYQSGNGDIVFGTSWYPPSEKSDFDWLIADNKYVMTGLFSGKQWRISNKDSFLEKNRDKNGWLPLYKEITCPTPLPTNDPDGRDRCHARIDHRFSNGNRLLYVSTDYSPFPYCYTERYFSYLALVAPDGRVLRRVTPIVVSKTKEKRDGLGGDPPCEDLPGGKTFKEINNWTEAPVIKLFMPLADGSFLLGLRPK